tara:strand:+ start:199 stop:423 length:225 start_codon:yes stop_codon:yes gene_type:complete
MKNLLLVSSAVMVAAFGSFDEVEYLEKGVAEIEEESYLEYYSPEIVEIPSGDPRARIPEELLWELEKISEMEDI